MYLGQLISPEGLGRQMRQTVRWLIAARQDADPRVKFLHASYGVANLDIIGQVTDDETVRTITGYDPVQLQAELTALQDEAYQAIFAAGSPPFKELI